MPQPSSSTPLTLTSPDAFVAEGFAMVRPPTLMDDPLFQHWARRLAYWEARIPELQVRPPRPYQRDSAILAVLRTDNLLAYEAGTGKSYVVALMTWLLYGEQLPTLAPGTIHIEAPTHTLHLVWMKKELAKTGLAGFAEVIDSERTARMSQAPIWVYSHDQLKAQTARGRKKKRHEPLVKWMRRQRAPGLLIIDEVHRLRHDTERTRAVIELRKNAKRVCGLTGTPMDGWVEHLSAILGVIFREKSALFPFTVPGFTRRFTRSKLSSTDFVTGQDDKKAVRKRPAPGIAVDQLPTFHQLTQPLIHRLTFADPEVSPHVHFPKMDHQILTLPPDTAHEIYYQAVHKEVLSRIADSIKALDTGEISSNRARHNVLTHLNTLRAAASHPWDVPGMPPLLTKTTAKLERIKAIAQQAKADGRKFIVYTNRIAVGGRIQAVLEAQGITTVRIYDTDEAARPKKLTQTEREQRIEKFQDDPTIDGLIGNLGLISEGLTLIEASIVIHHDHDWKSVTWSQGNNRVVRPGQAFDPVPVYDLLLDQTVDCYVHASMLRKAKATQQTIDRQFDVGESAMIDPLDVARTMLKDQTR